jgi:small subunit ribosomal protein S10e
MKSLESRKFVRITFSWQYNYCYLTDEGIEYLRSYLALPAEIVPNTHKKSAMTRPDMRDRESGDRPAFRGGDRGDREYRSRGGGEGGFGRGGGV